jgi:hypothetical protein
MAAGYESAYRQALAEIADPGLLLQEQSGTGILSAADAMAGDLLALSDE